jgi:hypothetical protein
MNNTINTTNYHLRYDWNDWKYVAAAYVDALPADNVAGLVIVMESATMESLTM